MTLISFLCNAIGFFCQVWPDPADCHQNLLVFLEREGYRSQKSCGPDAAAHNYMQCMPAAACGLQGDKGGPLSDSYALVDIW